MASGLFAILDDILVLMDDVLILTKTATKKTAGILLDDLAINADKASGFKSSRELPVIWKICKGSFLNKLIILPAVFLISAYLPVLIVPILICGGIYLSFEGVLNFYQIVINKKKNKNAPESNTIQFEETKNIERKRVKSAIFVDFILSIEIVIITLGTVLDQAFISQIIVVSLIAILATIGVYGFVAILVRIDDIGKKIIYKSKSNLTKNLGWFLVRSLPKIIRILKFVGTLAMILVGGGIFTQNINAVHQFVNLWPTLLADFSVGFVFGALFLLLFMTHKKFVN
ncbi:MAG: DUF808 family protein [Flavobacteriaceae bacterium]|nr:DUF808 family protein [Flavobacteriaceae bacterium]